jgi:rod shape determining protein RodA
MRQSSIFGLDFILLAATLFLMATGILFVYSSGVTSTGEVYSFEYIKQIIWVASGLVILLLFSALNYNRLREFAPYIYLFFFLLTLLTLFIGREVHGAKSWLGFAELGIQPSEFMKIAVILFLARYLSSVGRRIRKLSVFLVFLAFTAVPALIIMLQPDMGTALVFFPIFAAMTFIAGARKRHLAFILAVAAIAVTLTLLWGYEKAVLNRSPSLLSLFTEPQTVLLLLGCLTAIFVFSAWGYRHFKKSYFYWIAYSALIFICTIPCFFAIQRVLKDYQIMRLVIFLNPYLEPKGAGWNIIQSVTAIGSGGFLGKGWLMGTQSHYNYLPQQSTDFIFSILAEEWGFLGAFFVVSLFLVILLRGVRIVTHAKDRFAVLAGTGFFYPMEARLFGRPLSAPASSSTFI